MIRREDVSACSEFSRWNAAGSNQRPAPSKSGVSFRYFRGERVVLEAREDLAHLAAGRLEALAVERAEPGLQAERLAGARGVRRPRAEGRPVQAGGEVVEKVSGRIGLESGEVRGSASATRPYSRSRNWRLDLLPRPGGDALGDFQDVAEPCVERYQIEELAVNLDEARGPVELRVPDLLEVLDAPVERDPLGLLAPEPGPEHAHVLDHRHHLAHDVDRGTRRRAGMTWGMRRRASDCRSTRSARISRWLLCTALFAASRETPNFFAMHRRAEAPLDVLPHGLRVQDGLALSGAPS